MNKSLGIILILLMTLSCTINISSEKFDKESLISFKSEFVMEDGSEVDGYYENRNKFREPFFFCAYSQDTLFATTLYEVNSCAETIGKIRYSNDSLFYLWNM